MVPAAMLEAPGTPTKCPARLGEGGDPARRRYRRATPRRSGAQPAGSWRSNFRYAGFTPDPPLAGACLQAVGRVVHLVTQRLQEFTHVRRQVPIVFDQQYVHWRSLAPTHPSNVCSWAVIFKS